VIRLATTARAHVSRLRHDQSGLTLAELMVTMVLMGIVGSVMVAAVVSVTKTVTHNQANADSMDIARVAMNRMTKNLRSGMEIVRSGQANQPAIDEMAPNKVTIYASLGSAPTMVTYTLDAQGNLVETKVAATGTSPYWTFTGATTTTKVAGKVPTGAPALFTFLDVNGDPLPIQTATDDATTGLVRSIAILLTVDANPGKGGGPVQLTNTVVLPNLGVAKR